MKRFMLFSMLVLMFSSCYKYEEGPQFAIKTAESRLKGTWTFQKRIDYVNDYVQYSGFENWSLQFERKGVLKKTVTYVNSKNQLVKTVIPCTWNLVGDNLLFIEEEGIDIEYFNLLRLTNKEVFMENQSEYFELIKQ